MTQPDQYFPSTGVNATPGFGTYANLTQQDYQNQLNGTWLNILGPLSKICTLIADLPFTAALQALAPHSTGFLPDLLAGLASLTDGPKLAFNTLIGTITGVNWFTPTGIVTVFNALVQFAKDIIDWVIHVVETLLGLTPPPVWAKLEQIFEIQMLKDAVNALKTSWLAIDWTNWAIAPDLYAAWSAFWTFVLAFTHWLVTVFNNLTGVLTSNAWAALAFGQLHTVWTTFTTSWLALNWSSPTALVDAGSVTITALTGVLNWFITVAKNLTQIDVSGLTNSGLVHQIFNTAANLAGQIIDSFANTFLGMPGSGFSINDLLRSIQSVPTKFLTGSMLPGQISLVNAGTLSSLLPQFLVNPTFDTPNSLLGQGVWTWDGTQGPPGLATSVFTDATGVLKELLSNNIAATVGQTFNISGMAQWFGFSGAANSIALTVAQFDLHYNLLGYDTIASIASPGATSSGWVTLANTAYTVPATPPGIASLVLRPIVTQTATAGRVWFGNMNVTPTATTISQPLVPLLDASKIGTGQFAQSMVTNLTSNLSTLTSGVNAAALQADLASTWSTIISTLGGTGSGLSGLAAALAAIPGANISGSISSIVANVQSLIDAILSAGNPSYVAGSGTNTSVTTFLASFPQANVAGLVSALNTKALASDLTNLISTLGLGTATLTAVTNRLANLSATGTMPQAAITGLVTALNNAALASDLTALMNNLGAGSPTLAAITNRFTNLTAAGVYNGNLPIPQVINLSGYLTNLNTSGVLSGIAAVAGLPGYLTNMNTAGQLSGISAVYGLSSYLSNITSGGVLNAATGLYGTLPIGNVPTASLTRSNIADLGNVYSTINTTVGSGCIIYRASTATVSLSSNVGAQLAPGSFFDSVSVAASSDLTLTLGSAMFRVSLAGWYRCDICYQVQPAVSAIWNIAPVLFRNGSPAKYGVDSISFYTAPTGGATPRSLQSSFEIYCQAGDTLQAGLDAKNNTGTITNVLTGSDPAHCYFAISLENRSLV